MSDTGFSAPSTATFGADGSAGSSGENRARETGRGSTPAMPSVTDFDEPVNEEYVLHVIPNEHFETNGPYGTSVSPSSGNRARSPQSAHGLAETIPAVVPSSGNRARPPVVLRGSPPTNRLQDGGAPISSQHVAHDIASERFDSTAFPDHSIESRASRGTMGFVWGCASKLGKPSEDTHATAILKSFTRHLGFSDAGRF